MQHIPGSIMVESIHDVVAGNIINRGTNFNDTYEGYS